MSLSKETVDVLKACHPLLKEGREVVGKAFYNKLFEQHPQVVPWCLWWWIIACLVMVMVMVLAGMVYIIHRWSQCFPNQRLEENTKHLPYQVQLVHFPPLSICATPQSKQAIIRCQVTQWLPQIKVPTDDLDITLDFASDALIAFTGQCDDLPSLLPFVQVPLIIQTIYWYNCCFGYWQKSISFSEGGKEACQQR